jgi:lipopolysaccharide export system protein LptA
VLLVLTGAVWAEQRDAQPAAEQQALFQSLSLGSRKEPIQINSDTLELDYKDSTVTYRGRVHVTQGDVTLTSDQLSIRYDPSAVRRVPGAETAASVEKDPAQRIKEVVAEGSVRIRQGDRLAEGRRAVFDQAKQTIVLSDNAVLHDGPNQVAGDRIIVYLKEERSVVEGNSSSRVKAVLYPGSQDDDAGTAAPVRAAAGDGDRRP